MEKTPYYSATYIVYYHHSSLRKAVHSDTVNHVLCISLHSSPCEKWKLHDVLRLIRSTASELCSHGPNLRQLDNDDHGHLLVLSPELYQQIKIHSLSFDIFDVRLYNRGL